MYIHIECTTRWKWHEEAFGVRIYMYTYMYMHTYWAGHYGICSCVSPLLRVVESEWSCVVLSVYHTHAWREGEE